MHLEAYLASTKFQEFLHKIAAKQLSRYANPPLEAGDLAQIAGLEVWKLRDQFDPAKSSVATFATRYATWAIRMELRRRRGARDNFHSRTLQRLEDAVDDDGERANAPAFHVDYRARFDRRLDVEAVLAGLTDEQRHLCARLAVETPAQIAEADNVHRSTIYRRLEEIRRIFEQAGIEP